MIPIYKISVDGQDITNMINPEEKSLLENLTISDRIDNVSDSFTFDLSYDGSYRIPPTKGVVKVSIGYNPIVPRNPKIQYGLWEVGTYIVESTRFNSTKSGGKVLSVTATSMPQSPNSTVQSLQNSHNRHWQSYALKGTVFSDIVNEVCNGANLKANIHPQLADIQMPFTAQINQTDAEFLTHISSIRDGKVKYNDDEVIIELKDKTRLPEIKIDYPLLDIISYSLSTSSRNDVRSVDATYKDDNNKIITVNIGNGEPKYIIKELQPDKLTAENSARALLAHAQRNQITLNFSISTQPNLHAESPIQLVNFDEPEVNGKYIVEEVRHQLNKSSGLLSSITAKQQANV